MYNVWLVWLNGSKPDRWPINHLTTMARFTSKNRPRKSPTRSSKAQHGLNLEHSEVELGPSRIIQGMPFFLYRHSFNGSCNADTPWSAIETVSDRIHVGRRKWQQCWPWNLWKKINASSSVFLQWPLLEASPFSLPLLCSRSSSHKKNVRLSGQTWQPMPIASFQFHVSFEEHVRLIMINSY